MNLINHKGEGHRQRLRDKFLESGLSGFADYEVIELLLTLATPRKDCKEPAKAALEKFKTLANVIEAPSSELLEIKGIGPINIFGIKLIKEAADRYLQKRIISKDALKNSKELFDYLYFSMRDKDREIFMTIYLDIKNNILNIEKLFEGSIAVSAVYPREVIKAAIKNKAANVIFVHNHPSGDPKPSVEDISITKKLLFALKAIEIGVYDHIIIGDNKYYSFADSGDIMRINNEFAKR